MLQRIWKRHLYSGCQCYSLQVPVAPQKILFKRKWDRKGEGAELSVRISCNFFNIVKVFVGFFLSNFKFSDGLDRLFFKSIGIDGRCLKQRWGTGLPDVHGHGCVCSSYLSVFFGLSCWDEGKEAKQCCPRIILALCSRSLLAQKSHRTLSVSFFRSFYGPSNRASDALIWVHLGNMTW